MVKNLYTIDSRLQVLGNAVSEHMKTCKRFSSSCWLNSPHLFGSAPGEIDTLFEQPTGWALAKGKVAGGGRCILENFFKPTCGEAGTEKSIPSPTHEFDSLLPNIFFVRWCLWSLSRPSGLYRWGSTTSFQYDQVKQGRRQIGSIFKPAFAPRP